MERCPKCGFYPADRIYSTNKLICYSCGYREVFDDNIQRVEHYFDPITGKPMMRAKKFDLCPVCKGGSLFIPGVCEACGGKGVIEKAMGFIPPKIPNNDLILHHKYYNGTSIDHSGKEKRMIIFDGENIKEVENPFPPEGLKGFKSTHFDQVVNPSNKNAIIENLPNDHIDALNTHGFMPHHSGYPVSRDWEDIDCRANQCLWNQSKKCISPSLARIGDDGKCKGFRLRQTEPDEAKEEKISRKIRLD